MAWNRSETKNTKHTCGGPVWGKKTPGCPRCDELLAGAPARQLSDQHAWALNKAVEDRKAYDMARKAHFAPDGPHVRGECGPVCTAFDW